jgi:uncharacterized repeat protein (TIGR01451 family)
VTQTQHEWCRLINLVEKAYPGSTAVQDLFDEWVIGGSANPDPDAGCIDLETTMTDSPDPVLPGDPLTYTIKVTNKGPQGASQIVLKDTLPGEVAFFSATPSQGSCMETVGLVTCDLGDLANGDSAMVTMQVTVLFSTTGGFKNTAEATAAELENKRNNSATTITNAQPALVFASDRSGRRQVWKIPLSPLGTPVPVTTAGSASQESRGPDWSRQDGRIAYQFGAPGVRGIHTIKPDGTDDVRETFFPSDEVDPS